MLDAMTTQDEGPEPGPDPEPDPESVQGAQLDQFSMQFTSSPRGARLARRLAVKRMEGWGHPAASDLSCSVALLVGELAANAVSHGRLPGRDFRLRLSHVPQSGAVRIEVSDANPEPPPARPVVHGPDDESGRGLLLVDVLAARWGTSPRHPVGKTVWAEVEHEFGWGTVADHPRTPRASRRGAPRRLPGSCHEQTHTFP